MGLEPGTFRSTFTTKQSVTHIHADSYTAVYLVTTHSYTNLESQSQQQSYGLLTSWAQQAPISTTASATVWGLRYQRLQCTQYRVQQLEDYIICRVTLHTWREREVKSEQEVTGWIGSN